MNFKKTKLITIFYLVAIVGLLTFSAISLFSELPAKVTSADKIAEIKTHNPVGEIDPLSFFSEILSSAETGSSNSVEEIFFRLFVAVSLTALLAFRPKKSIPLFKRNFHVLQTQILLAVVAASLMMIVGNNAARAFAIFAAVSLVRFRTNIRNPKEVTVLLVSLAIGLAAGVGYWQLGAILCFFVMVLLWFLEYNEDENSFRSMELTVRTRNTNQTRNLLESVFEKHRLESELRRIELSEENNKAGRFTYFLNLRLDLTTEDLTEQIMFSDSENIFEVRWKGKRKALQIYE
jgi:uncharacterized membrane protein YhiD involved in acid resistance